MRTESQEESDPYKTAVHVVRLKRFQKNYVKVPKENIMVSIILLFCMFLPILMHIYVSLFCVLVACKTTEI